MTKPSHEDLVTPFERRLTRMLFNRYYLPGLMTNTLSLMLVLNFDIWWPTLRVTYTYICMSMDGCMDPSMDPYMDPSMDPSKKSWKFAKTSQKLQKNDKICKNSSKFKKVVKSSVFPWYIRQFWEKVLILLHTFENYDFRASEIGTPIEDQKSGGRFVERIRESERESLIGHQKCWRPVW